MFNWSSRGREHSFDFVQKKGFERLDLGGCFWRIVGGTADKDLFPLFHLAPLRSIWALPLCASICRFINKEASAKCWSFTHSQKVTTNYGKLRQVVLVAKL